MKISIANIRRNIDMRLSVGRVEGSILLDVAEAALALREQQADNIMAALAIDDATFAQGQGHDPDRRRKTMVLNQALAATLAKVSR